MTMESPHSKNVKIERLSVSQEIIEDQELQQAQPSIRPSRFVDYPGQEDVKRNLEVYVGASRKRAKPLDHVILHGAPGLGKTTLANIIANELDVPFIATSGPAIDKPGDLAGILTGIEPGTLVFIDEIHRLSIKVEEVLYSAMEDFAIDIIIGQGASARSVRMDVAPFTLVGATTRLSLISRPLLGRFGIQERLEFYEPVALKKILFRSAMILGFQLSEEAAQEIAMRVRNAATGPKDLTGSATFVYSSAHFSRFTGGSMPLRNSLTLTPTIRQSPPTLANSGPPEIPAVESQSWNSRPSKTL